MMRNWRVEDNLVTLYIAKHKYKNLNCQSSTSKTSVAPYKS
jgi:hypothetical protein